jgi:transcriptional regulator with XRE-family HTH domain
MEFKKQLTHTEVDGDRLKIAREALGLSQKELATKLCLSHRHIAQLEGNQLSIFFTPAHKVQVAKKVGAALGLQESDYLIQKIAHEVAKIPELESFSAPSVNLPNQKDLFVVGKDPLLIKPTLFLAPILFACAFALGIGTQMYSHELSMSDLAQMIGLKTPMSQLHTFTPETPLEEASTVIADNAGANHESEIPLKSTLSENCSFEASQLTLYQTSYPSKKGEMVYVLSKEPQSVCVIDSQNKAASIDLAAGDSKSFYGQAPFTVVSSDLSKFDLYFQGWKVKSDALSKRAIRLEEVDYLAAN